ncbi:ParA family protein [Desulfospira joergensenii]|uniref:ParA family protein n=1 Tax=Desulfospira joergensenii TaxID=53329 RepID=UPI0003B6BDAA|nr:AAA family ATPase [Desulfospira joergensenii]
MVQIISIANQKGGVGKTTTAVNLSASLAKLGKRVLLVDCDSQANATTGLGIEKPDLELSLYQGMIGEADARDIILSTMLPKLKLIPSNVDLIGFEIEMVSDPRREAKLKQFLVPVQEEFDFIIIDCPPALSLLTLNAFTASHSVLIPLQSEFFALEGLGQLLDTVKRVKSSFNPGLKIKGILLTMFDRRTNLAQNVMEDARQYFKDLVFKTKIPRNVKLGEAPSYGLPALLYDKASQGSKGYMAFARELLRKS